MKTLIFLFALISVLGYTGCGKEPVVAAPAAEDSISEDPELPSDEGDDEVKHCHKKVKKFEKKLKKLEKEIKNES